MNILKLGSALSAFTNTINTGVTESMNDFEVLPFPTETKRDRIERLASTLLVGYVTNDGFHVDDFKMIHAAILTAEKFIAVFDEKYPEPKDDDE